MARGGHPCAAAYRMTGGPGVPMVPPSSPEKTPAATPQERPETVRG